MTTWMKHPKLPPDQLIEVDDASVPHHRSAGWTVTEAPPPPPRPDLDDAPAPASEPPSESAPEPEPEPQAPKAARRAAAPKEADK